MPTWISEHCVVRRSHRVIDPDWSPAMSSSFDVSTTQKRNHDHIFQKKVMRDKRDIKNIKTWLGWRETQVTGQLCVNSRWCVAEPLSSSVATRDHYRTSQIFTVSSSLPLNMNFPSRENPSAVMLFVWPSKTEYYKTLDRQTRRKNPTGVTEDDFGS